jgi:hypothetical protein
MLFGIHARLTAGSIELARYAAAGVRRAVFSLGDSDDPAELDRLAALAEAFR